MISPRRGQIARQFRRKSAILLGIRGINQAVIQGVPFMGVQVLRLKMLMLLHEKKGPEKRKNEVKFAPPSVPPPEALYEQNRIR